MENSSKKKLKEKLQDFLGQENDQEVEKCHNTIKTDKSIVEKKITKTIVEDGRQILNS